MTQLRSREQAAAERARQVRQVTNRPSERRDAPGGHRGVTPPHQAQLRTVRAAGEDSGGQVVLEGYACVTERGYEMWDMFGPYSEVVSRGAFSQTLLADPLVKLLFNHRGMPMARTGSSMQLNEDSTGLFMRAEPVLSLPTTQEVLAGIDAGLLDEMSFAFMIVRGQWSPDYMEYRIDEVDIDRGDVSVVTYGANPYTSVGTRESTPARQSLRTAQARIDAAVASLRTSRA